MVGSQQTFLFEYFVERSGNTKREAVKEGGVSTVLSASARLRKHCDLSRSHFAFHSHYSKRAEVIMANTQRLLDYLMVAPPGLPTEETNNTTNDQYTWRHINSVGQTTCQSWLDSRFQ
jgi:hypothetical protein